MTDWSRITPTGGPSGVETARDAVAQLRMKIPAQRTVLADAKARLVEAEQADRLQMSEALRQGREPKPDTREVEKARAAVAGAQRAAEALTLAIANSEAELGETARGCRTEWLAETEQGIVQVRDRAASALEVLRLSLDELRNLRGLEHWLTAGNGLDREQRAPHGRLGASRTSASWAQNQEPVAAETLLEWLAEALGPATPTGSPAEPASIS